MIENFDDNVGRLVDELEQRGIRDETAIISDHGEILGSHGLLAKQHPYEESIGIPFIVSYPDDNIDDGTTIDIPTCVEDWYPTLLGLAGIDVNEEKLGINLILIIGEKKSSLLSPPYLFR